MNFIKCIELISKSVGVPQKQKTKKGMRDTYATEYFEFAGKKLKVKKKSREFAKQAWNVRNNGDMAHQSIWDWRSFPLSYDQLDEVANEYLLKYLKYIT